MGVGTGTALEDLILLGGWVFILLDLFRVYFEIVYSHECLGQRHAARVGIFKRKRTPCGSTRDHTMTKRRGN